MTTATPIRPLDDMLRERWATGPKHSGSVYDDDREGVIRSFEQAVVGDYFQYDDDPEGDDGSLVAPGWIREMEAAIAEAGVAAFEAYVVPAMIEAIKTHLPTAPEYLRVFPKSETLRADLAALEKADR